MVQTQYKLNAFIGEERFTFICMTHHGCELRETEPRTTTKKRVKKNRQPIGFMF